MRKRARQLEHDRDPRGAVVGADEAGDPVLGVVMGPDHDVAGLGARDRPDDVPQRALDADALDAGVAQLPRRSAVTFLESAASRPGGGRAGPALAGRRRRGRHRSCSPPSVGCALPAESASLPPQPAAERQRRGRQCDRRDRRRRAHHARYVRAMAQGHMDRLTAIDASFLTNESPTSHMHIGAVTIFEGPPPSYEDCSSTSSAACTSSRATGRSSPSRRSRPAGRSGSTTRSSTSTTTSATRRCRRPATRTQLRRLAARVFSQQLDRTKPLWELWLVEGLRTSASR